MLDQPQAPPAPILSPGRARAGLVLLGLMAAAQGTDPNIASTALVGASRGPDMTGGLLALAASISTPALSASVISTGLVADRAGRRPVLMGALLLAAVGDLLAATAPAAPLYLTGRALAGTGRRGPGGGDLTAGT